MSGSVSRWCPGPTQALIMTKCVCVLLQDGLEVQCFFPGNNQPAVIRARPGAWITQLAGMTDTDAGSALLFGVSLVVSASIMIRARAHAITRPRARSRARACTFA
jgi:hypothetical protein